MLMARFGFPTTVRSICNSDTVCRKIWFGTLQSWPRLRKRLVNSSSNIHNTSTPALSEMRRMNPENSAFAIDPEENQIDPAVDRLIANGFAKEHISALCPRNKDTMHSRPVRSLRHIGILHRGRPIGSS